MEKIDYKQELKQFYNASAKEATLVEVPPLNYLAVDGAGDPNIAPEFHTAVEALYSVAYAIKFAVKKERGIDYGVMPLEGLWWADDMSSFCRLDKANWRWTLLIMQPEFVDEALVKSAIEQVMKKKGLPAAARIRLETVVEGVTAQLLHIGPYAEEAPTIEKLHRFVQDKGYGLRGKHHEIYLGDPRKAAPEKLKTILRQPVG